jgi:hypothetical protein
MERLALIAIVKEAVERYRQHFSDLLRVIALPALAHAVILYVWYGTTEHDRPLVPFLWLAQSFLMTLAAVSCHRVILLGPEAVAPLGASGTAMRDWRFIWTATLLYVATLVLLQIATTLIFLPLGMIYPDVIEMGRDRTQLLIWLAALPALYVTSRFAICLPAVATDRRLRFDAAWRLTRGNGLRLLVLVSLLPWLLQFTQRWLAESFESPVDYLVAANLLFWLLLPLEITVLSLCYRRLGKAVAPINAPSAA